MRRSLLTEADSFQCSQVVDLCLYAAVRVGAYAIDESERRSQSLQLLARDIGVRRGIDRGDGEGGGLALLLGEPIALVRDALGRLDVFDGYLAGLVGMGGERG